MTPILLAGPATEPLSPDEMRAWLRIETHDEDALIAAMIKAARCAVEQATRRALLLQKWRLRLPRWPQGLTLRLPLSPVLAIDAVRTFDAAGNSLPLDLGSFDLTGSLLSIAPQAVPSDRFSCGIEIDVTAGFGAQPGDVPEDLRQAMRMLIAHWYERRSEALHESNVAHFPAAIAAAVVPWRQMRLA